MSNATPNRPWHSMEEWEWGDTGPDIEGAIELEFEGDAGSYGSHTLLIHARDEKMFPIYAQIADAAVDYVLEFPEEFGLVTKAKEMSGG